MKNPFKREEDDREAYFALTKWLDGMYPNDMVFKLCKTMGMKVQWAVYCPSQPEIGRANYAHWVCKDRIAAQEKLRELTLQEPKLQGRVVSRLTSKYFLWPVEREGWR